MQLSAHFSLEELTHSDVALRAGVDNTPSPEQVENLRWLANALLEPSRDLLAAALHINSGFRSTWLNRLVFGAPSSAHLDGRAADMKPIGRDLPEAFDLIARSPLPFDQCIYECAAWIHLAVPSPGCAPRREVLRASGTPGHWRYELLSRG